MLYSSFSLLQVQRQFELKVIEGIFFVDLPTLTPGEWLTNLLAKSAPFAAAQGSEKVRSELIVAPLLFELRELLVLGGVNNSTILGRVGSVPFGRLSPTEFGVRRI